MPGTKLHRHFDKDGKELPSTQIIMSDEELADEAEQTAMAKAEDLIDAISSLKDAKIFLKRLVKRLIKNGSLL